MKSSSTKLIAVLAIAACTLTAANALAKGGNGGGGNHSFTSHVNSSNFSSKLSSNTFKLNKNITTINSISHSNNNVLTSKNLNVGQVLKKQGNNPISISNSLSLNKHNSPKIDKLLDKKSDKKDFFCKDKNFCKDKCCFDWCYPWYFGCYNHCYDWCYPSYCYPTYSCSYVESLPVLSVVESTRVRVVLGSVIMLNGQSFGGQPGGVRLRVSGMALPIQVVEWTPSAVKAQLPQIELTGPTLADIEVIRPDGSLASKTPVELTVPQSLALGR
jgi:hypothetical protein